MWPDKDFEEIIWCYMARYGNMYISNVTAPLLLRSTPLLSFLWLYTSLLPAQQRSPSTKCSQAYQTMSLYSGDNQSEFITRWNFTHPPTGCLIFMSFGCFSCSQAIILQINQWLSLLPASILCGSLLARPAVQLQMLWGQGPVLLSLQ